MNDEQIFTKAIELPPERRRDFLDEVSPSDSVSRKRMEAMIRAYEQSDSLLDTRSTTFSNDTVAEVSVRKTVGDFEIIRELGRGGMGIVYEARQKSLKRRIALKLLSSGLGLSSKAILRFRREAEAAGKLHHTNIVPIYTTGEDKGIHFYAMELIEGPSLDAVIRELRSDTNARNTNSEASETDELPAWVKGTALFNGPKAETNVKILSKSKVSSSIEMSQSSLASGSGYFDQVATMVAEVADALDHAHEHGVIHRDIKPSNLLLAPDGRLSINDFGLARMLEQPGMTMSGEFVGSPLYMSPEQITAGRVTVDHRTDIYSFGATLYELLTLQPPFPGQTRDQVLSQILQKDAVAPRKINRKVPIDLDTICMKAIDKDPDRRYQTAGHLADDLRKYVNRHAISARRIGVVGKAVKYGRRNPMVLLLAIFVLLVISGASGVWILERENDRRVELETVEQKLFEGLLSGDPTSFDDLIERAGNLGATDNQLTFYKGLRELLRFDPDLEEAEGHFAEILKTEPDNIAARSMLAHVVSNSGDEIGYLQMLSEIPVEEADTFEGTLFLGYASHWGRPQQAYELLQKASKLNPNEPFVEFQLGAATRHYAVSVVNNLEGAEQLLLAADRNIKSSTEMMPDTSVTHAERLLVGVDLIRLYEAIGTKADDAALSDEYRKRAQILRVDLHNELDSVLRKVERPSTTIALAIVHTLIQIGDDDQFRRVTDSWSVNSEDVGVYAAQMIAIHSLVQKDYAKADFWFRQIPGRQSSAATSSWR